MTNLVVDVFKHYVRFIMDIFIRSSKTHCNSAAISMFLCSLGLGEHWWKTGLSYKYIGPL